MAFERLERLAQRMFQIFLMAGGVGIKDTQNLLPIFSRDPDEITSLLGGKSSKLCKSMASFRDFSLITVHCFGWYFKEIPVYKL